MKRVFTSTLIPKKSDGFLPPLGGKCVFLSASFLVQAQEQVALGRVKNKPSQEQLRAGVLVKSRGISIRTYR